MMTEKVTTDCANSIKRATAGLEKTIFFSSYEDAVEGLIDQHGASFLKPKESSGETYNPRKNLSALRGVAEDFFDVEPDELMDDFGFRGVQFGNYLSNKQRQEFLNNTYDALEVISRVILQCKENWIGGKKLGLAFGARGKGKASAHYEPELKVINLTKHSGPGSIAHELFHSIDHRLAMKLVTAKGVLLSDYYCEYRAFINSELSDVDLFQPFKEIIDACCADSEYVKNANKLNSQKGGKKYWNQPCELLARAFEAWVQDELEGRDIIQEWAAFGTKECDYENNGMHPYPCGDDRVRINNVFRKNIPVLFGV